MPCRIEVLFSPAEFRALRERDLSQSVCVVFDVLRATSTFVTALANGAEAIIPVEEISEALEIRRQRPEVLLAGERNGLRIGADLTGGVEFDLGNSPREYTPERVRGRTVASTTTNGTRALRACQRARAVFLGSFLNLGAVARVVVGQAPEHVLLICAGTGEGTALEDVLAAGALCQRLMVASVADLADSAQIAVQLYLTRRTDLAEAVSHSQNARRLLAQDQLREDVAFCLRADLHAIAPSLDRRGRVVVN
jgi:2-phosphosulfolactate phosphatase